jgi:hypothetical protein
MEVLHLWVEYFLIEKLGISKDTNKRTALQMVVRILEKMQEVEKIEVEKNSVWFL